MSWLYTFKCKRIQQRKENDQSSMLVKSNNSANIQPQSNIHVFTRGHTLFPVRCRHISQCASHTPLTTANAGTTGLVTTPRQAWARRRVTRVPATSLA